MNKIEILNQEETHLNNQVEEHNIKAEKKLVEVDQSAEEDQEQSQMKLRDEKMLSFQKYQTWKFIDTRKNKNYTIEYIGLNTRKVEIGEVDRLKAKLVIKAQVYTVW